MAEQILGYPRRICLVHCGLPPEQCACYMAEGENDQSNRLIVADRLLTQEAEITRLRAALADAQAVGFAAGVEAAAKRVGFTECPACGGEGWEIYDHEEHDCQTCFGRGVVPHLDKSALTPPDLTAAAARVLLPIMEQRHIDRMTSLGRDPEKYTSEYSMVAKALRAIAGDTP